MREGTDRAPSQREEEVQARGRRPGRGAGHHSTWPRELPAMCPRTADKAPSFWPRHRGPSRRQSRHTSPGNDWPRGRARSRRRGRTRSPRRWRPTMPLSWISLRDWDLQGLGRPPRARARHRGVGRVRAEAEEVRRRGALFFWPRPRSRSLLLTLDREQERRGYPLDTSQKTNNLSFLFVKWPEKVHVKILSDSTTKITIKIIVTKSKGILIYFEGPTRNEVSKSRLFDNHSQLPLPNNTCSASKV